MFTYEDLRGRLKEQPFKPFRIIVSEGLRYDIGHPELVFVGLNDMMVGFDTPSAPGAYSRVTRVAYIHVVALEDLPASATGKNGVASA